ncbi:LAAT1 protein, partial [Urocolius indicus]|nr:LAAT1 protein [Urocolius indicus]
VLGSKGLRNFCVTWIMVCIALCVIVLCQLLLRNHNQSTVTNRSNSSLDMIEMSGFICGYMSCVFYLGSRFPQLYKNFRRRSTEGTSYLLFALAMMGNSTYGLSLVLKMPAAKSFQALYFLHHLPWLIGSFGVLFLDLFVSFSQLEFLGMGLLGSRSEMMGIFFFSVILPGLSEQ